MTIRTLTDTVSTNADMTAAAREGAPEGLWLRAERQSGGRGRQGRVWASPPGNLYASTLVRLRPTDPAAATLSLVAGVAVQKAVGVFLNNAAKPVLKWPNDLLLDGAKLAGILLERVDDAVVVGVGVNVLHHPDLPDRATTSLAAWNAVTAPATLMEALTEGFARWLSRWRGEGVPAIRAEWVRRAHPPGTALAVHGPDGRAMEGLFDGLDADGALILRLASGERRVIHAGDVFLL